MLYSWVKGRFQDYLMLCRVWLVSRMQKSLLWSTSSCSFQNNHFSNYGKKSQRGIRKVYRQWHSSLVGADFQLFFFLTPLRCISNCLSFSQQNFPEREVCLFVDLRLHSHRCISSDTLLHSEVAACCHNARFCVCFLQAQHRAVYSSDKCSQVAPVPFLGIEPWIFTAHFVIFS